MLLPGRQGGSPVCLSANFSAPPLSSREVGCPAAALSWLTCRARGEKHVPSMLRLMAFSPATAAVAQVLERQQDLSEHEFKSQWGRCGLEKHVLCTRCEAALKLCVGRGAMQR